MITQWRTLQLNFFVLFLVTNLLWFKFPVSYTRFNVVCIRPIFEKILCSGWKVDQRPDETNLHTRWCCLIIIFFLFPTFMYISITVDLESKRIEWSFSCYSWLCNMSLVLSVFLIDSLSGTFSFTLRQFEIERALVARFLLDWVFQKLPVLLFVIHFLFTERSWI